MLILLGIIILIISFVIAVISMIREQAEVEGGRVGDDLKSANENAGSPVGVSAHQESNSDKPQAKGIDVLKSRIEELSRQDASDESAGPQMSATSDPNLTTAEKEMLQQVQSPQPAGQSVIEPKEGRFPDGEILVQELAKKRQGR